MAVLREIKFMNSGGLDSDTAIEYRAKNDYWPSFNIRTMGTQSLEEGYVTNIESNQLLSASVAPGINRVIGSEGFPQIRSGIGFLYNSAGYHQIRKIDYDTQAVTTLFTNLSDTAGVNVLDLSPQHYVDDIKLINETYLLWNDAFGSVGFTNLNTLEAGGYGTVLAEDFSLIKPQNLIPITGEYISDAGRASNFLKQDLFQFTSQWEGFDFTKSAWATWSKRIIPPEESTPIVGTDVTKNNGIAVSVNIGSIRVKTIDIASRIGTNIFNIIKQVERLYVVALPNTAIDVSSQIYEAYDPATNLYSFVFYNEDLAIPVDPLETDLPYDAVPEAADALEVINGDIVGLGGLHVGYPRPATPVSLQGIGYDPNITVPEPPAGSLFRGNTSVTQTGHFPSLITTTIRVQFGGSPETGDILTMIVQDSNDATNTANLSYAVPSGQAGNLGAVIASYASSFAGGSYSNNGDGTYTVILILNEAAKLISSFVTLFNAGATVSRSIHSILDNSSYQLAISYRDIYGRFFPLDTDNTFIVNTPSYAQVNGQAIEINWAILAASAPANAVDYQWLITVNNTVQTMLDVLATPLNYISTWDAHGNSPSLLPNVGTVGDTYQITTPSQPTDERNLGNGVTPFNTGDYVVYNGQSWDIISKQFGDLTTSGNILAFKINPLDAFNQKYTNAGADPVLTYDFVQGDRCTLHYYVDGAMNVYINTPCVDLDVLGYDPTTFIVKMEKSATFDETTIAGKDVFIRLYSPKPRNESLLATQWFEIGERFPITGGLHTVLSGFITDGDVYYKTRQYSGAFDPNVPYEVLATDFNFSDFYPSAFWSGGRPRTFNDEIEQTIRPAIIARSEPYIFGSKNNGLTRFYPANVYGDAGGETSSNYGTIRSMKQVNNELVIIQELNHGSVPVYANELEDAEERQVVAISNRIFGNIRYTASKHIGVGNAKSTIAIYNNIIYWVDPNRSEPIRWSGNGAIPISGKMSKYFKATLQAAYAQGLKIIGWYDIFNDEYVISIQQPGGVVQSFAFSPDNWQFSQTFTVLPGDITITRSPSHSSASYNNTNGIAVLTPDANYVGTDAMGFSFPGGSANVCFNWTAGSGTVNPFGFMAQTGVNLSTVTISNTISVSGNDYPVPISITGDTGLGYSINGGAYTSSPGTVKAGDIVSVRVTSSGAESTLTSVILTIDSQSAEFDVVTKALGNFTGYAQYGGIIDSIVAGTGSGVPAGYAPCNLTPGQAKTAVYTTLTAGTYSMIMDGTPSIPGHVSVLLSVNGVTVDSKPFLGPGNYVLTLAAPANDPDQILFTLITHS